MRCSCDLCMQARGEFIPQLPMLPPPHGYLRFSPKAIELLKELYPPEHRDGCPNCPCEKCRKKRDEE